MPLFIFVKQTHLKCPSLWTLSLLVLISCDLILAHGLRRHKRQCCKYSVDDDDDHLSKVCENSTGCILEQNSNNLTSPPLDMCRVLGDSKKDITTLDSREQCLRYNYTDSSNPDSSSRDLSNMFELRRYIMDADNNFVGIEVVLPADKPWFSVRFRIFDLLLCPQDEMSEFCAPRCVDIEKQDSVKFSNKNIVYDCEGGFFVSDSEAKSIRSTSDDTYQFDICFNSINDGKLCRTYLFEMGGETEDIILVEQMPLIEQKQIVLHMSERMRQHLMLENKTSKLEIYRISDFVKPSEGDSELVQYFDLFAGNEPLSYELIDLPDGDYMISILAHETERISIAKFQLSSRNNGEESDGFSVGLTSFLVILVISAVLLLILYRRYRQVQQSHQVSPHRLLESGRVKAKDVFIITNVDNRHHINIVLDFAKYLKNHCAVGEVYFALDPETGITTEPNHDPWKWAQSVADKMADTGCLLFIGAPPEFIGISIYKDLPNRQAFISTMHLKKMADENRVAVALFPYSDTETLPTLIPQHIRNRPYHLPNDMNSFLCQLLEVKKRELCPCIPLPIVQPEILPQHLIKFKGGSDLLESINSLTAKVELQKAEMAQEKSGAGAGSTLSRIIDDLEIKQLLRPDSKKKSGAKNLDSGLKIDLESNLCSIRDLDFETRDKSTHPEFEKA